MVLKRQAIRDAKRDIYSVTFPTDISAAGIQAWMASITGSLSRRSSIGFIRDTLVFETWGLPEGISHRIMTPHADSENVSAQLRAHGRGVSVALDEQRPMLDWTAGVEVGMSNPLRQLSFGKNSDISTSLLTSIQPVQDGEAILIQWVITPAGYDKPSKPRHSGEFRIGRSLIGVIEPSNDEVRDTAAKLAEQNVLAIGRVMTKASTPARAVTLLNRVKSSLAIGNSGATLFTYKNKGARLIQEANDASSPLLFPAQFSLTELVNVISWPTSGVPIAGVSQGVARQVFATSNIPSTGRVLGTSNYSGHERPIAVSYEQAVRHSYYGGATGTGKTTAGVNSAAQDMRAGHGVFVIDASNSESHETMFEGVLRVIPPERIQDVIIIDPAHDRAIPVSFNPLDQGHGSAVRDQITALITKLYSDTSGVWTRQLLFYGLGTLLEYPGLTLVDLMPLIDPKTDAEKQWAAELIRNVKDPDVRDFWARWNSPKMNRDSYALPLYNRIWQIVSRPEIRDIIGQGKSSFSIDEVIRGNKILLVNLSGLPSEASSILGSLLVSAIWTSAQSMKPEKPNFMYLDEFQVMMTHLSLPVDDLLDRARKHHLGLVLMTQRQSSLSSETREAVVANTLTKLIFNVSSNEANQWQREFNGQLKAADFQYSPKFNAVVSIDNETATIVASPPTDSTGMRGQVAQLSRSKYGRPVADVERERQSRRAPTTNQERPLDGYREWTA